MPKRGTETPPTVIETLELRPLSCSQGSMSVEHFDNDLQAATSSLESDQRRNLWKNQESRQKQNFPTTCEVHEVAFFGTQFGTQFGRAPPPIPAHRGKLELFVRPADGSDMILKDPNSLCSFCASARVSVKPMEI